MKDHFIIREINGEAIDYTIDMLRAEYNLTSFPDLPIPDWPQKLRDRYALHVIARVDKPAYNHLIEYPAQRFDKIDGVWTHVWDLIALSFEESKANVLKQFETDIQEMLDAFAGTRGYSSFMSAVTYVTDPNPRFAAEAQYCVELRSQTWTKCYEILAEVEAGTRIMPTGLDDILPELPVPQWPA